MNIQTKFEEMPIITTFPFDQFDLPITVQKMRIDNDVYNDYSSSSTRIVNTSQIFKHSNNFQQNHIVEMKHETGIKVFDSI